MHVDDLSEAIIYFLNFSKIQKISEIINIGLGSDVAIKELAYLIKNEVLFQGNVIFGVNNLVGVNKKLLNTSIAKNFGNEAQIKLHDGIRLLYSWYLSQNLNNSFESKKLCFFM